MFFPTETRTAELEIKKSRFIACARPVETEYQAREILQETRSNHPKCNHVVWAYILGEENSQLLGMSDDGEPKGTAGKPALSVLQYSGLTNILVTVVRYFGGTKLGTGGLVRAYTDAARAVTDELARRELIDETSFSLRIAYPFYDGVKKALSRHKADITDEDFTTDIRLECTVATASVSGLKAELSEATNGSAEFEGKD